MDLTDALLSRRTVYRFEDRPIPGDVLERALEAARWAPNHRLTQPWRFLVVGPETRQRLGPIAARLARVKAKDVSPDEVEAVIARQVKKVTGLPGLIVVTNRKTPDDPQREREDYAATCCALHNLVLQLWADGVGAQWGTGGLTRDDETYRALGIEAAADEIIGFVKCGYPAKVPRSERMPLDEVVVRLP